MHFRICSNNILRMQLSLIVVTQVQFLTTNLTLKWPSTDRCKWRYRRGWLRCVDWVSLCRCVHLFLPSVSMAIEGHPTPVLTTVTMFSKRSSAMSALRMKEDWDEAQSLQNSRLQLTPFTDLLEARLTSETGSFTRDQIFYLIKHCWRHWLSVA